MLASQVKGTFSAAFESATIHGVPLGHAMADACLRGGLRPGALHEVFAAAGNEGAASGFALALARRVLKPAKWLLWVRQDFSALENGDIHAAGLLELGIDPDRVVMVRAPDAMAALRAGAEGLDCTGMAAVIIESWGGAKVFDLVASRKLTLAAQRHGVTPIVLHFGMNLMPSAAETRWLIGSAPTRSTDDWGAPLFDAALIRNRHGTCGRWLMQWDCENGCFQTHSGALAAAACH